MPFFYNCSIITSIGYGLITTWTVGSSARAWIGYQILEGIGTRSFWIKTLRPGIATVLILVFFGAALFGDVTSLRQSVPAEYLTEVFDAYIRAMRWLFQILLILACLFILSCLGTELKKFKGYNKKTPITESESSVDEK
ncbi:hypothetical protein EYZ11_013546 [Aspergillus tanneri]|uniref:Uncharacterized protein n=1 Tax=Aspergillus tanneri TaxID=1220188 RepID=A0A4S3IXE7_9EURO|nr:hypothetical protein EYZ11_013546 [Aspergillus tanneri]